MPVLRWENCSEKLDKVLKRFKYTVKTTIHEKSESLPNQPSTNNSPLAFGSDNERVLQILPCIIYLS